MDKQADADFGERNTMNTYSKSNLKNGKPIFVNSIWVGQVIGNTFAKALWSKNLLTRPYLAIANSVSVKFTEVDVLELQSFDKKFDIIVSNPPYIKDCEKEVMSRNVLDFEPHQALFVSDNDALIFYSRIADIAMKQLNANGWIYFEINQANGHEVVQLLQARGFVDVELKNDISGNDRMVRAMKE